jgi:hypothetical protein
MIAKLKGMYIIFGGDLQDIATESLSEIYLK